MNEVVRREDEGVGSPRAGDGSNMVSDNEIGELQHRCSNNISQRSVLGQENGGNSGSTGSTGTSSTPELTELVVEMLRNQTVMLEEVNSMRMQQLRLKEQVESLQREQERFHVSGYKRMDQGFKKVDKCLTQMEGMNEVFKEVIGIISGERVRFLDHSQENLHEEDAHMAANSELLEDNGRRNNQGMVWNSSMSYNHDRPLLEASVKREEEPWPASASASESASVPATGSAGLAQEHPETELRNDIAGEDGSSRGDSQPLSQTDAQARRDFVLRYRMNRAVKTVKDLAREYYEGLPGQPSVLSLERRFGSTWRSSASERTFFHKRFVIIQRIESILRDPAKFKLPLDISRRNAVRVVENIRIGNNTFNNGSPCCMTLAQLYIYFSKKMDSHHDYSLTLINKDVPSIREIKNRLKKSI